MKKLSLVLSVLSLIAFAGSAQAERGAVCLARAANAPYNCSISAKDIESVVLNVDYCTDFKSKNGNTVHEVFRLDSGKVVLIQSQGQLKSNAKGNCPRAIYNFGSKVSYIEQAENKVFIQAATGQLYVVYADQTFWEVLNSSGKSYNVREIKARGTDLDITFAAGNTDTISASDLQQKRENGKLRQVKWSWSSDYSTSLFD